QVHWSVRWPARVVTGLDDSPGRHRLSSPPGLSRIPRAVLVAGLATLVLGALAAIALSGPDAPPHGALGPPAPLPAAPPPVSATSDAPTGSPSVSAVPSSSQPSLTRSPSPTTVHTEAPPVGYEAESPANVLDSGARVAPMDGASGGRGVYGIGGSDG